MPHLDKRLASLERLADPPGPGRIIIIAPNGVRAGGPPWPSKPPADLRPEDAVIAVHYVGVAPDGTS